MLDSTHERIIVALDVPTELEALELVRTLKGHVGLFKIGLELLTWEGVGIVQKVAELGGKVFYDGKFNDIPNTVAGASRGVTRLAVRMFNVHAMGGVEMMKLALEAATEEARKLQVERPLVLGVTILTSIDQATMKEQLQIPGDIESQVVHLTKLAEKAGLDGVIASPQEIIAIRSHASRQILIVTPGVRPSWAATQDQKRIMTPGEAIKNGASYVVIGRPITKPPAQIGTPVDAARRVAEEIAAALAKP
ncbi:orotidine-5'-phosphate decarboxylase [Dehalococcoidia bacterium]|nr:orotidine-5'-phosphate decarboxylase [Dehalococcoidia bacterium]MCL0088800.1 orotidine-5'-phosphate decarboxylase [Dehalococcoidia bacterium]MCL0092337.1 orotidine-5'-phosphate decarboxylase [Dehalococcoidia bacterium]